MSKVGEAEKNAVTGNVDTIKSTRYVGTVSLMLFSVFKRTIDSLRLSRGLGISPKRYFKAGGKLTGEFVPNC